MWYQGASDLKERALLLGVIDDFNNAQDQWTIALEEFPYDVYNESVVAAALSGDLPDIISVDGPNTPNWAWAGYMGPLELSPGTLDGFLPGAISEWNGEPYAVGLWDSAVAIFARKSVLERVGTRIPTLDNPWTLEEFDALLVTLQESGESEFALDVGMGWGGEWIAYAIAPFLQSFGGDLVDRSTYRTAEGVLNGPEAIAFGNWWQSLFTRGLVHGATQDGGDRWTGFIDSTYALQWQGNFGAVAALAAVGDDMLFLPAPDFGTGAVIGNASWQFGIAADSENKEGARAFLEFLLQDKYSAAFSDATGWIPPTSGSVALTENFSPGGALEIFYEYSVEQALIRPPTPGYVAISRIFVKALFDIADGADVGLTLDAAVDEIDADLADNDYYGF